MRRFSPICGLLIALAVPGTALAADPDADIATLAALRPSPAKALPRS